MMEVLLGFPEAASESKLVRVEHLLECTLGFHTSEREGKGSRIGQRIRLGGNAASAQTSCNPMESPKVGVAFQIISHYREKVEHFDTESVSHWT